MTDSLSAIFKNGLFVTTKNPNRDWMQISGRAGNHLYSIICEEFANPEVALCAIVHSMAEILMCQTDKAKREKLMKCVPDILHDCLKHIEDSSSDEPYEYEGEGQEEEEPEESEDPEEDTVDARPVSATPPNGKMVENPNGEDEDEDEEIGDPDPDEGFPGPWMPNKGDPEAAPVKENPAKMAGFKRKPRDK